MAVTPEIEAEIMRAYNANPKRFSPFRVAKAVGATINEVTTVVNRNKEVHNDEIVGVVRRELEPYIAASRRVMDAGWNNDDDGVVRARRAYEAGTHEMATHREGGWLHLCSFPRARPRRACPGYFTGGTL